MSLYNLTSHTACQYESWDLNLVSSNASPPLPKPITDWDLHDQFISNKIHTLVWSCFLPLRAQDSDDALKQKWGSANEGEWK